MNRKMFALVATTLKDAGFEPHVRTNDDEILIRDKETNILYKVTVTEVTGA